MLVSPRRRVGVCSQSAVDAKAMSAARECQRREILPGGRKERMNLGYAKRLYLPPPTLAVAGKAEADLRLIPG